MEILYALVIPLVNILIEVVKRLGVKSELLPVIAIIIGIVVAWLGLGWSGMNIIWGIIAGLAAVGLWELGTKTLK